MKFTKILKTFALSSLFLTTIHATQASLPGLTFETNHPYANNLDVTKDLHIVSFAPIKSSMVTIQGELEKDNDFLIVTDNNGKVTKYTGVINEAFTVQGNGVTVRLITNHKISKKGLIVNVSAQIDRPEVEPSNTFKTGNPYKDNEDITKELSFISILPIKRLMVTMEGEVEEGYDFITIIDDKGNKKTFTGILDQKFTLNTSKIKVNFTSDGSVSKKGAVVKINLIDR